jgi:small subunit ribosomal protein S2e
MGNFIKALYEALGKTYGYLSPDLWAEQPLGAAPFQEHTDFLAKKKVY